MQELAMLNDQNLDEPKIEEDTDTRLKVVVMTTKLPEDVWLINSIADSCCIEGIIFPRGIRYREYGLMHILKTRLKRGNILTLLNQALLVWYRKIVESWKDKRAFKKILGDYHGEYIQNRDTDVLEVDDINSGEVRDFILEKLPDVVVVSGAPILKSPIIEAAGGRIINLHPGFTPQYRGRYGDFWPIYNEEPDMVGATVHFLDKGIDTGSILMQQRVGFCPYDTLKMINYRQYAVGADMLRTCLSDFDVISSWAYKKSDCPSRNFFAPGLTHYLKAKRFLRKKRRDGYEV